MRDRLEFVNLFLSTFAIHESWSGLSDKFAGDKLFLCFNRIFLVQQAIILR